MIALLFIVNSIFIIDFSSIKMRGGKVIVCLSWRLNVIRYSRNVALSVKEKETKRKFKDLLCSMPKHSDTINQLHYFDFFGLDRHIIPFFKSKIYVKVSSQLEGTVDLLPFLSVLLL